jgi:hypothetical protein
MDHSLSLREATVQDIHLELIRRTSFNAYNGEKIYASLMKHVPSTGSGTSSFPHNSDA